MGAAVKASTPEWAISKRVQITRRLSVTLTAGPGGMTAEWDPDVPKPGSLGPRAHARYFSGRHQLLSEVAKRLGAGVLVIDL
jgi:hypothetical protein